MQRIFISLTSAKSPARSRNISIWSMSGSCAGRNGCASVFARVTTNRNLDRHSPSSNTPSYAKAARVRTISMATKQPIRVTWPSEPPFATGKNITRPKSRAERLAFFRFFGLNLGHDFLLHLLNLLNHRLHELLHFGHR